MCKYTIWQQLHKFAVEIQFSYEFKNYMYTVERNIKKKYIIFVADITYMYIIHFNSESVLLQKNDTLIEAFYMYENLKMPEKQNEIFKLFFSINPFHAKFWKEPEIDDLKIKFMY